MPDNYITLNQLTKTTKGLVNKINTESTITNSKIGDLANLNTTAKTDLVAAINEAAANVYDDTALAGRVTTLENAGYITSYTETDPTVPNWAKQSTKPTYTASEVGALPDTTIIPTVPTDVSAFNNDAGYLTSYTETDPTVPAWAKAANKPTYTAAEVGALPDTTVIPAAQVNADWDATSGVAQILHKPTIPNVPSWALAASKPTYTASEVGALPSTYTAPVTSVNGQTGTVTLTIPAAQVQSDWNATSGMGVILNKPTIPAATTVTQTLTSGTKIGEVNGVSLYAPEAGNEGITTETDPIFSASPAADITTENIMAWNSKSDFSGSYNDLSDKPTIPIVPTNVSAFTNDSGYLTSYTETDPTVPAWAKAESKPTYTASEVGAATSSHVHGNVKNDGTITVNTSMANGDRLLFSDASDSNKIKNTSITIGTSTTQYLANNGTWQNLPTVSVSQTLTSGTEIGSVNSTKLYAPVPYDDSALAARVTALEQLEWATYYSGRSNPSNSQGQNGDIYLQY